MVVTKSFENLRTLCEEIKKEIRRPARYPALFILLKHSLSWNKLLDFLSAETEIINLASFCQGEDVTPLISMERIKERLTSSQKPLTLVPLCAWLRLNLGTPGPQEIIKLLAEIEAPTLPRLLLPFLDFEDRVLSVLEALTRIREGEGADIFELVESPESIPLTVSIPMELRLPEEYQKIYGLKSYFEVFERPLPLNSKFWLFTKLARGLKSESFLESLASSVEIAQKFFPELKGLSGTLLKEEFATALLKEFCPGEDFRSLAARLFNLKEFDFLELLKRWALFSSFEKKLFYFWAKLEPSTGFWHELLIKVPLEKWWEEIYEVPSKEGKRNLEFLKERKAILASNSEVIPEILIRRKLLPKERLSRLTLLTDITREEKLTVVKELAQILQETRHLPEEVKEILSVNYPLLLAYFNEEAYSETTKEYFNFYKIYKVIHHPPKAWPECSLNFDSRHYLIEKTGLPPENEIWIDGLGAEWLGILYEGLKAKGFQVKCFLARANLPTITETNQPPKEAIFIRDLDETAHRFRSDFAEFFLLELETISRILETISEKLKSGSRFVITGDHGLSLSIFNRQKIPLPSGAEEPHRAGRVASIREITAEITSDSRWKTDNTDRYLCLTTHGRFAGGQISPQGEVHGGALYEEILVPVIEVYQGEELKDFSFKVLEERIRLDSQKEGKLSIILEPAMENVRVVFPDGQKFSLRRISSNKYEAKIRGLEPGEYKISLFSSERFLGKAEIQILPPALIEEDMGL